MLHSTAIDAAPGERLAGGVLASSNGSGNLRPENRQAKPLTFSVIYADPPWKYSFPGTRSEAGDDYPTMSAWQIGRLPVEAIAAKDCALLMWGIWPRLGDSLDVMRAWGFEYKSVAFVWVKANRAEATGQMVMLPEAVKPEFVGMGMWTRSNTEFCLLATKGKPKRASASVRQVIYEPLARHSEKPQEARKRIVELFGDVPRIELFARQRVEGWAAWGNEIDSDVHLHTGAVAPAADSPND